MGVGGCLAAECLERNLFWRVGEGRWTMTPGDISRTDLGLRRNFAEKRLLECRQSGSQEGTPA